MENTSRQSGLDGLRGLAALCVFAVHVWIYQLPNTVDLQRDSFGELVLFEARVAFVMFFVLSGYLLYRPFARAALGESSPVSVGLLLRPPRGPHPARLLRGDGGDASPHEHRRRRPGAA